MKNITFLLIIFTFLNSYSHERISIHTGREAFYKICNDVDLLFPEWSQGQTSTKPFVFYNLNGDSAAYLFTVKVEEKYVGYYVTGAYNDLPIHVDATNARPPQENTQICKKILSKKIQTNIDDIRIKKYIWSWCDKYFIQFDTPKGKYYMDLIYKSIVDVDIINSFEKSAEESRNEYGKVNITEWANINDNRLYKSCSTSKIISGIDAFTWYRGCISTSLAMIFNYYGSVNAFSNLWHTVSTFNWDGPGSDPRYTAKNLVDHFSDYYGWPSSGGEGDDYGYDPDDMKPYVPNSIVSIANSHGYTFSYQEKGQFVSSDVKKQIDQDRPFAYVITGHCQVVVGYANDGSTLYYYNTYDTSLHSHSVNATSPRAMLTPLPYVKVPQQISSISQASQLTFVKKIVVSAGTYTETDDITIPSNITLELDPGVVLRMASGKKLTVNGWLIAQGSAANPITFQSVSGYWYGIDAVDGYVQLEYCYVQNASYGVRNYNASTHIYRSAINSCAYHCISFNNTGDGWVQYSNFSKPGGDAIDCNQYASPDIHSYNDFTNSLIGINVDATSYPDVGTTYNYGRNDMANLDYAIYSSNVNTIYAENNWFGSAPPDPNYFEGTVDYTPYLSSDPTSTTYPKMNAQQRIVPLNFAEEKIYSTDKRGQEEFKQAYDAYANKNLTAALPLFQAVYQEYPNSPIGKQALAFAAKCSYKQNGKSNVGNLLEQVNSQYKNTDIAVLAKSLQTAYMLRAQQYDDAIAAAEEIVGNHKTSSYYKYALYDLGNVYWMHLKDKSTGEKYYRQLIEEFPKDELSYSALTTLGEWTPEMEKQFTEEVEATSTVFQNHPNPFNPVTTISFKAAKDDHFRLKVYNIRGQEVAVLLDGHRQAGTHQVLFDASNLPTGTYFYRLDGGGMNVVKKMILLK